MYLIMIVTTPENRFASRKMGQTLEEKKMKRAIFFTALLVIAALCVSMSEAAPINVTYNINADGTKTPISKYVYGSNWGGGTDYTIRRSGGNRLTAYNWENNWSNAGADWYYENDQYMSSSPIPGKAITDFHDQALSEGQASIVTLQMAGYVSAPIWRQINLDTEAAPSIYFYPVTFAKGAAFSNPPNTSDTNVYMDEFVNFLVSEYGYAGSADGVKFYDLDNEPALWSDGNKGATHPEVHPAKPTYLEMKTKSIALSTAVKNVDPNAQILGCVAYGFMEFLSLQDATDRNTEGAGYNWYISYFLDKMEAASATAGKRLLDVLDVHWYPEARDADNVRITDYRDTRTNWETRMQAPRTLWDYDYHENSWIEEWQGQWLPILPPLQSSINTYYPDTNLAVTEYAYGGETHWSGGIATSDVLGIFGKYGVYIATYWGSGTYVDAAIKIYRNYDGSHSTFGDMDIPATITNKVDSSIYASMFDGNDYEIHLIVINKNQDNDITGTFNITSGKEFDTGRVWAFDGNNVSITERTPVGTITNNSFTYTIPKVSVCHIVLTATTCPLQYDITGDCEVDLFDLWYICDVWLLTGDCSEYPDCPDLDNSHAIDFVDIALLGTEWGL